ncbi:hypothetical protein [Streptomyces cinereoruber]|uniref:hypothetical protein n=1 Tax=Streptomyces cinereoruber TaxID=67260 RepID=UPI003624E2B7
MQRVRIEVARTQEIPHAGRAYLEGDVTGDEPLTLWVLTSLVTEQEARDLEAELNDALCTDLADLLP